MITDLFVFIWYYDANQSVICYYWYDMHCPRKPKYFNHIHTVCEWNKYNQKHHYHDNPSHKIAQGYKFNIFYPVPVDKLKAPTYTIEKDGNGNGNGETCIIRFHVGFSSHIPFWLNTLFKEKFFDPCLTHENYMQKEKNIFCLDCCVSFCSNCLLKHCAHRFLQIRKYNHDRVVKTEDMGKLIHCSLVQSYMLNRAMVVFLKERSPSKKKDNAQSQAQPPNICCSCPRILKEEYDYCSITCMVKQVLRTEGSIVRYLRECRFLPLSLNLGDSEFILREPTSSSSMVNCSQSVGLKIKKKNNNKASHSGFVKVHRRKGVPVRSPFY